MTTFPGHLYTVAEGYRVASSLRFVALACAHDGFPGPVRCDLATGWLIKSISAGEGNLGSTGGHMDVQKSELHVA